MVWHPQRERDAPIVQQLFGMPVGGRHDCFSETEAVGERAGCHLSLIEIRRHVDVTHRNEFQKSGLIDKFVEKNDVVLDAKFFHSLSQGVAVDLALMPH